MRIKRFKVLTCLLIILTVLLYSIPSFAAVKAEPTLTAQTSEAKPGDTVTLLIKVIGISGTESGEGVQGLQGKISYDTNVFSDLKVEKDSNWSYAQENAGKVIAASQDVVKSDSTVMKVTLKVKDNASAGTSTITLSDCIIASSTAETVNANKTAAANIKVGAASNNQGENGGNTQNGNTSTGSGSNSISASSNNAQASTTSNSIKNITTVNNTATKKIPKAGKLVILPFVFIIVIVAIIAFKKFNNLNDI